MDYIFVAAEYVISDAVFFVVGGRRKAVHILGMADTLRYWLDTEVQRC